MTQKLNRQETVLLMQSLSEVTRAGLPLPEGLLAAANEIPDHRVSQVLRQLSLAISRGEVSEADRLPSAGIPSYLAGILKVGVRSGRLSEVISELTDHFRINRELWMQVWGAISYPLVLFGMLLLLSVAILMFVAPAMQQVFADFDTEVPAATRAVFWAASTGWKYLLATFLVAVVTMLAVRRIGGARSWTRVVSSIPGFGALVHWYGFAEFARVLRLLLAQDVALPEALEVTSQAMQNANVAHSAKQFAAATATGQSLSASLAQDRQVPQFMVPLVRVGEEQNALCGALQVIGELFEGYLRIRSQLISSVAPPLMLLLIGGAAITLPFCLLLPLVSLITNLGM